MDFKMWVLSGHYQGTRNFTFESLEAAKTRRLNWRNRIAECYQTNGATTSPDGSCQALSSTETPQATSPVLRSILDSVGNNLNSPEAFAAIDNSKLTLEDWRFVDELFGLRLMADSPDIDDDTRAMIFERQTARERKDYAESDRLRDLLAEKGISVKDTPNGPIWQYI